MSIIVVGGGLAGLMATLQLVELGQKVKLFSLLPARRAHSVCAQGGINAVLYKDGQFGEDSVAQHFKETIVGGDFLANQKPVQAMCQAAPRIIHLLDRMGVPFERTAEGHLALRRFGGTRHARTAYAGATTGQQIMYALDEQVRRAETTGQIERYEYWEFVQLLLDQEQRAAGIIAQHVERSEFVAFKAAAVILATGGLAMIYGKSTNSLASTGAAAGVIYTQGADYANGEFMQLHPTAISGVDKLRLMSESARAEGGRLWVYKEGKPWYFLEEMYPAYGNLVPRDIAVRAIFKVCHELGLGIDGELAVYLDLTHLSPSYLRQKLGGILDIYQKFTGDDPCTVPMKVCPAMHYSMGGLWVDEQQMTSIKGLFAAGECEYQYHGANRLGANSMLSCLYAGLVVGKASAQYTEGLEQTSLDNLLLEAQVKVAEERYQMLQERAGQEESYLLYLELGEAMSKSVSVIRENTALKQTDEKLQELSSRIKNVNLTQAGHRTLSFTRELESMLKLARVITLGALKRDESRGSHYKPEFPERDDENWLKTTRVNYSDGEPLFTYEEVDTSLLTPKARRYDV